MNHTTIRKWMLYGGAFFLAIATFTVILANSSRFTAEVASQPLCVADAVTGAMPSNCNGGGSGGGTVEQCIDPVTATGTTSSYNGVDKALALTNTDPGDGCACYNDPPFDTAFDSKTTGAFGSGGTALSNSVQLSRINQLLGVETAEAQTGGNQLAESKNFEGFLKTTINKAINEQKDKFKITVDFLKYPSSYFNDPGHLEMFRVTFANELTSVLSDPTLPYDQQIRAAQLKVPQAFTKAMESFVYGKKDHHTEALPTDRSAKRNVSLGFSPNWSEWLNGGFGAGTIKVTFNDQTNGNNGSYTKNCNNNIVIGIASGGSRNWLTGATLDITHGNFRASGYYSKPNDWAIGARYSISF